MKKIYIKIGIIFIVGTIFTTVILNRNNEQSSDKLIAEQQPKSNPEKPTEAPKDVLVSVDVGGSISQINLDDYLLGVVAGEMPASFEIEAIKAQVVASRTFVYSRNLTVDNTTKSQVYLSDEKMKENWKDKYEENKNKITQAIKETNNEVMMYQGIYISALFFSSSNGYTENSGDYFQGDEPYLKSVDSHWDLTIDPSNVREKTFTKKELQTAFNCSDASFNIVSRKKSGRVDTLTIDGETYTGRQVREKLGLASTDFTIKLTDGKYIFTTVGSGHGVGMSQYGAQGMALEGKTYKEILNYYYTNIEIVNN